ncbi:MAG: hypothetical protein H7Y28_06715 [Rhodoferax sp.]|nr:hypothetical protein [Rhodoferax sp.]
MNVETLQLLSEVSILLVVLYLALFKSYFQEKGKNIATKEDVREITSLMESVKAQLQYSLQAKLSLRADEHQARIDYFSKYSVWLAAISNCSTVGISKENSSQLAEIRSRLDMLHQDFDLAAGKMELFVENADVQSQHGPLVIETLKFQSHAISFTFATEKIHSKVAHISKTQPFDEQLKQLNILLEEERDVYKKFKDEQLKMYTTLIPSVQKQRNAISKHMKALTG